MEFGDDIYRHLQGLERGRIYSSEGLAVSELEGQFTQFEDGQTRRKLLLDGENGWVRTNEDGLLVPTLEIRDDDSIKFAGVYIFDKDAVIPHIDSQQDPQLVQGVIKPWACRKEHFTDEAWTDFYKSEVRRKQAAIVGSIGASVTALTITIGVALRRKKTK